MAPDWRDVQTECNGNCQTWSFLEACVQGEHDSQACVQSEHDSQACVQGKHGSQACMCTGQT